MSSEMLELSLSDDDKDAIKEMLNIGAGNAARVLSELLEDKRIQLGIPEVDIKSLSHMTGSDANSSVGVSVNMDFMGSFKGRAQIFFTHEDSQKLSRIIADDIEEDEIGAVVQEVISEVGNIVINGVMGIIANLVEERLSYSLPLVLHENHFSDFPGRENTLFIAAGMNFSVQGHATQGELRIFFLSDDLNAFTKKVRDYFDA